MYSTTYLNRGWPSGGDSWTCKGFAAFRYMNAYSAWMALGFVAFSRWVDTGHSHSLTYYCRCLSLSAPRMSKAVSRKKRNLMMVFAIWLYSFLLVLPTILHWHGRFGYAPEQGKCDYLTPREEGEIHPRKIYMSIGFLIPLLLIVASYVTIWRTTIKSSSFLKRNS